MNAAFLLVTTAWLAGADPAPPAKPAPAPIAAPAAAPIAASHDGGCGCDSCCDEECGHHLFGKLKGLFHHKCECDSCDSCGGGGCGATTTASCGCDSCECGHGHHFNLGGLFHHKSDCCDSCDSCNSCGTAAPAAPVIKAEPIAPPKEAPKPPAKMPAGDTPGKQVQAIDAVPASPYSPNVQTATKSPFELSRRYESRVAHAPDYSSLTGQLFYVHADGGLWVLRFAPLWQEDRLGGSVILARDLRMEDYREGDLVTIHGEILSTQRSSVFLGGPLYRAQSIQLIDRPAE